MTMNADNIPTAEEILNETLNKLGLTIHKDLKECIIDNTQYFAKLHVEAALKAASEKADTDGKHVYMFRREYVPVKVDKNSILNAYPLTNIK